MAQGKKEVLASGITTGASYTDTLTVDLHNFAKALCVVKNNGSNNLNYKILGSPDKEFPGGIWLEIHPETTLLSGAVTFHTVSDAWGDIKLQHKSTTSGSNTTIYVWVNRKRH